MPPVSAIKDKREGKAKAHAYPPLVKDLLKMTGDESMVYVPRQFVSFTGSFDTAAMLNQLLHWHHRGSLPNNWVYKTSAQWAEELCISKHAIHKARERLELLGIIKTLVRRAPSGTPTVHYQCDLARLNDLWQQFITTDRDAWLEGLEGLKKALRANREQKKRPHAMSAAK